MNLAVTTAAATTSSEAIFAVIFVWCLLAVLVGEYAQKKGHSAWVFTVLSIVTTPLIGLVIALLVEDKTRTMAIGTQDSPTVELARLGEMKERGLLTEAEFASAKSEVLGRPGA